MATGLETAIARTAGQIIRQLGGHVGKQAQLRKARDAARPLMAREVADSLLGELDATEAGELAGYLVAPDFEQVALQFAVARLHPRDGQRDELLSAARDQIRQGLRLATTLPAEKRFGVTDVVYDALLAAEHTPGNPAQAARLGHLVAAAARNGELLSRLTDLKTGRAEARRLRTQVAAIHAELRMPHTGVSRSVGWDRLYVESRPYDLRREPHPVRELAQAGRRLVVLGDPGAGKSTLATKLAYDLAADPAGTEVPFLVVLRHLSAALQRGERTLAEHLAVVARDPYNVTMSAETVDYLLLNGRAVVILDGLDELTDVSLRRRLTELVRGFATLYPMVPIVVTSRRVGYREAALDAALFPVYDLMPFEKEQVEAYAGHWFALDDGTPAADRRRLAESFLRDSESVEDLRSNPLLLALLCAMYAVDRYIPRLRAQIYERCALMVFERWDSMRGIGRRLEFEGRVRRAVQHLACHQLVNDEPELPRHRVVRLLTDHLMSRGLDEDDAEAVAAELLEFCAGRAWVLTEVGSTDLEPVYGFSHRTFLEFFAAEHLVRTRHSPEAVWHQLAPRVRAGEWEVVAQLAVQLVDRNTVDGAEAVVRTAMAEAARSEIKERAHLAEFGAIALQHVALPPAEVERIVAEAMACFFTVPAEDRFRALVGLTTLRRMDARDTPLRLALHLSLESNFVFVRRAVGREITRRIAAGDERGHLLLESVARGPVSADRLADLTDWRESLIEPVAEAHGAWRERWFRTDRENLAGRPLAHLYQFQTALSSSFTPMPGVLDAPGDTERLGDHLLGLEPPWFDRASWRADLAELDNDAVIFFRPWEIAGFDDAEGPLRSAMLVIALPYLELARDADGTFGFLVANEVARSLVWPPPDPRALRAMLRVEGVTDRVADFLMRWSAREFRVLGATS
ncbi:NACHT domain-containing protein [Actinoplanes sp. NPDC049265]|uniref:NACHT domain-containing protein n=1 Tax=Actinoplanes sp. NPDC049265 TaxID=3363902 RepID=UPI00371A90B8